MRRPGARELGLGSGLLFLLLAFTTLQNISPAAETAPWASADQRTVLQATRDSAGHTSLSLAGPVSEGAADTVDAELTQGWSEQRLGPLRVVHSRHRYRTDIYLGSLRVPWMVNDYTAAFPDWVPLALHRATGSMKAGLLWSLLLAAGIVGLASGWAARRRGALAGLLVGVFLATDLWFHIYKKLLGSTELWLQGLSLLLVVLLLEWRARRNGRTLVLAGGLAGLCLSVKVTSFAVLLPLLVGAVLVSRRPVERDPPPRGLRGRPLVLALLAFTLGFGPTWSTYLHRSVVSQASLHDTAHDTVAGRLFEVKERRTNAEGQRFLKQALPSEFLLEQGAYWRGVFRLRGSLSNQSGGLDPTLKAEIEARSQRGRVHLTHLGRTRSWSEGAHQAGLLALLALAMLGGYRRRGIEAGLLVLAGSTLLLSWWMHGDTHHLALATPLLGLALGLGAAAGLEGLHRHHRALALAALVLLALGLGGRLVELRALDQDLSEHGGRLMELDNLERLTEALVAEGATSPAVLSYELVALLEGFSGGEVRPWLWWKSNQAISRDRRGHNGSPEWLRLLLRTHSGGHLLIAWAPPSGKGGPGGVNWVAPSTLRSAGADVGLTPRVLRQLYDSQGRWYATLWALPPSGARPPAAP